MLGNVITPAMVQIWANSSIRTYYKDEGLSSAEIDAILSEIAASGVTGRIIDIRGNDPRTSASDAAVATLTLNGNVIRQDILNEPEVDAYIDGLITPLSSNQINELDTLVGALKTSESITSLEDSFEGIWLLGGETQESALKNLVKNSNHATVVGTPNFTQFEGFDRDGGNNYINLNFNIVDDAVVVGQNDLSVGLYSRTNTVGIVNEMGGIDSSAGVSISAYYTNTDGIYSRCNSSGVASTVNNGGAKGMTTIARIVSNEYKYYKNGVNEATITTTSAAPSDKDMYVLCRNNNGTAFGFSNNQIAIVFIAKGNINQSAIAAAFEAYMTANGKGL